MSMKELLEIYETKRGKYHKVTDDVDMVLMQEAVDEYVMQERTSELMRGAE